MMPEKPLRTHLRALRASTAQCLKTLAWQTCKCIICITCSPCICCAMLFFPHRRSRRNNSRAHTRSHIIYPPLPYPRERALSLPMLHARQGQVSVGQRRSMLFERLPPEVRRLVWKEVLGSENVYLRVENGKLVGRRCDPADGPFGFRRRPEERLEFGTAVLRTCRRVYSEAIDTLYAYNDFFLATDWDELCTLTHLGHFILPQRLAQIRSLHFYWEIDSSQHFVMTPRSYHDVNPWLEVLDPLHALSGLRYLHIELYHHGRVWGTIFNNYYLRVWGERVEQLLEIVGEKEWPREFYITLPDPDCEVPDVGGEKAKCRFLLPASVSTDSFF